MLSLSKIIAPVDFSARSPGAARSAGRLACHFHSELTLLHVLDSGAYDASAYEFIGPVVSALPAREAE
jgi:nucleotide-binding universal stress UspA family protein